MSGRGRNGTPRMFTFQLPRFLGWHGFPADRIAGPKADPAGAAERPPDRTLLDGVDGRRMKFLLGLGGLAVLLLVATSFLSGAPPTGPAIGGPVKSAAPISRPGASFADFAVLRPPVDPLLAYEARLDHEVAAVLSRVAGAGPVEVVISVAGAPNVMLARQGSASAAESRNKNGRTERTTRTNRVVTGPHQGGALVTGETAPKVVGALVVAPGAADPTVRLELTQAVEALLGLWASQVMVLPGETMPRSIQPSGGGGS